MDTIIYLNATIKLHFGGLAIYECENGFIGFCDARCGDIGDNPMITDKSEMISIDRLPYKWRENKGGVEKCRKLMIRKLGWNRKN